MATNFKLKRSSVANKRPGLTNLELGELALNTYDGYLFTERNGLGITTVTNLTPWYENYGAASIFYSNSVGIGTTNPIYDLDVRGSIGGFNDLRAPHRTDVVTYTVTVATKDATHRYNGTGSSNGYKIDGEFSPFLVLTPGRTYKFDQSHSSNSGHPINFYLEADKTTTYSTGVTVNGTAGSSGAYTQIVVGDQTPLVLHYQCTAHGYMGNAVQVNSNVVNSNYPAILRGGLNVSGAETILSSATVSDLTSTRVVYAGTSGSLEDSANLTFTSNTLNALNIDVDGLAELDDVNVSAASTFAGAIDANGDLDVDGHTNLDNVSVAGVTTFFSDVKFSGANYDVLWDKSDNALEFVDNAKAIFGTGGDLEVYTDGSDSYVENSPSSPNNLYIRNRNSGKDVVIDAKAGERSIHCKSDSAVELYYDATKRLATSGVGVTVYNQLDVTNINASGIITAVDGNFTGNVSIAGTLTYQDVTNVDSFGIGTFRTGVHVLSNGIDAVGVITATQGLDAIGIQSGGVNITTGIITAINFTGTGNTVTYDSSTKIVSVSVGGAGGGTGGKFVENNTGIHTLSNVGIGTTNASDKLKVLGDVAFTGALKVSPLGLSGSNGNYLKSVGSGVTWASFPTARTVGLQTATNNQTSFSFAYNVGFLDVYINGVKLTANEFTATNGTTVVLTDGAFTGDQVQFISFNTTASGGGGGSGISEIVQDTTPQLGGNLDLNSKIVNGTGNIDYTGNFKASGIATATTFVGALTGNVTGNISGGTVAGTTGTFTGNVTLGDSSSDTISMNGKIATDVLPSTNGNKDLGNSGNRFGEIHGVTFHGSGAHLSGVVTSIVAGSNITLTGGPTGIVTIASSGGSSGVTVQDEGSALSTAGTTLNFVGSGVVASGNGATKTITIAGGSGTNPGFSTAGGSFTVNAGVTTVINTFNINTNTKLSEYTIHLENVNGNIQSQKVLVMNYGAGIGLTAYSSEYGIMFHPNQIADIGVVVTAGICSLTATTKSGITGITTFSLTRQDQS